MTTHSKFNLKTLEIIGFFLVTIMGILFHFAYDFSGNNQFVALFVPINESVFEHLKLLFYPYLIYMIIEYFLLIGKQSNFLPKDFLCVKLKGLLIGLYLIPTLFYTYSGLIGRSYVPVDITIYIAAVLASFIYSYFNFLNKEIHSNNQKQMPICLLILLLLIILFLCFTIYPPNMTFFKDY